MKEIGRMCFRFGKLKIPNSNMCDVAHEGGMTYEIDAAGDKCTRHFEYFEKLPSLHSRNSL